MTSEQPNEPVKQLSLWEEFAEQSQNIQRDDSTRADIEKSALSDDALTLMEQIVDEVTMEMAWVRVKTNRGAAGPDGITVKDFPEWIAMQPGELSPGCIFLDTGGSIEVLKSSRRKAWLPRRPRSPVSGFQMTK